MLLENNPAEPRVLKLAEDAAATFDAWWTHQPQTMEYAPLRMKGHLNKYPGYALRVALCLEHLWWCIDETHPPKPTAISKAAVDAAIQLMDQYFRPMAERVYGDAEMPEIERRETTLANWIIKTKPQKINARHLYRKIRLPGLRKAMETNETLEAMVEAGWLISAPARAGETDGRQRNDYTVDQRVYRSHG